MKKAILTILILIAFISCNNTKKGNTNNVDTKEINKIEKEVKTIDSISVKIEKETKNLDELLDKI